MRLSLGMGPQKNTFAAKKMAYLATSSNPVSTGDPGEHQELAHAAHQGLAWAVAFSSAGGANNRLSRATTHKKDFLNLSSFQSGQDGEELGLPIYEDFNRNERELIRGFQIWGEEEWSPECILEVYGPATWAQDGS
ncbi:hypothetical protein TURU_015015 [Turdus rufiventris]|nr:hypothetical protein TURU_015015 [Turdus rufiventris]